MYRHVLVAIDDSETSRKALDEAIALANAHGARLAIAHAVDESLIQSFGFRRLLLGSVAEKLMRKAAVSLLIVRGHA